MTIIEKLRSMIGTGETERTFTYECEDCDLVFESETVSRRRAACPECGNDQVRSAPRKSPSG